MTFYEKLAQAQDAIRKLHADEALTAQDRAQCMIAADILRNLSPHRAQRDQLLKDLAALGEPEEAGE